MSIPQWSFPLKPFPFNDHFPQCNDIWLGNSLGEGGRVPRVQIMENELECLGDRKGHDSHLAKKFLKKYYS